MATDFAMMTGFVCRMVREARTDGERVHWPAILATAINGWRRKYARDVSYLELSGQLERAAKRQLEQERRAQAAAATRWQEHQLRVHQRPINGAVLTPSQHRKIGESVARMAGYGVIVPPEPRQAPARPLLEKIRYRSSDGSTAVLATRAVTRAFAQKGWRVRS